MRAAVIDEYIKSPGDIKIKQVDVPELDEENDIMVEVYSCALSFADTLLVQGKYQTQLNFPYVPGQEFAGVIINKHKDSDCDFKVGDRVAGIPYGFSTVGALSSFIACSNKAIVKLSDQLSFDHGCGFPVNYATTFLALKTAEIKAGETLVVSAAGGGVGTAACQMGAIRGAKVIALAGSEHKCNLAMKNGATYAINYNKEDIVKRIKELTNGNGFDVMLDQVGGKIFDSALRCMAWNARVCIIGFTSGVIPKVSVNRLLLKQASLIGISGFGYLMMEPENSVIMWNDLFNLQKQNQDKLKPVLYEKKYTLDNVGEAFLDLNQGKTFGKVVIQVKNEAELAKL